MSGGLERPTPAPAPATHTHGALRCQMLLGGAWSCHAVNRPKPCWVVNRDRKHATIFLPRRRDVLLHHRSGRRGRATRPPRPARPAPDSRTEPGPGGQRLAAPRARRVHAGSMPVAAAWCQGAGGPRRASDPVSDLHAWTTFTRLTPRSGGHTVVPDVGGWVCATAVACHGVAYSGSVQARVWLRCR
jgi:hypothetical protein